MSLLCFLNGYISLWRWWLLLLLLRRSGGTLLNNEHIVRTNFVFFSTGLLWRLFSSYPRNELRRVFERQRTFGLLFGRRDSRSLFAREIDTTNRFITGRRRRSWWRATARPRAAVLFRRRGFLVVAQCIRISFVRLRVMPTMMTLEQTAPTQIRHVRVEWRRVVNIGMWFGTPLSTSTALLLRFIITDHRIVRRLSVTLTKVLPVGYQGIVRRISRHGDGWIRLTVVSWRWRVDHRTSHPGGSGHHHVWKHMLSLLNRNGHYIAVGWQRGTRHHRLHGLGHGRLNVRWGWIRIIHFESSKERKLGEKNEKVQRMFSRYQQWLINVCSVCV